MRSFEYLSEPIGQVDIVGQASVDDATMNELGAQGWELIGIVQAQATLHESCRWGAAVGVFKREKIAPAQEGGGA